MIMKNSQIRRVAFSPDLMFTLLGDGEHKLHYNVASGISNDSVLVGISQDVQFSGVAYLLICSASFTPVKEGDLVPELIPQITTVN